jgi:hypothetical protein
MSDRPRVVTRPGLLTEGEKARLREAGLEVEESIYIKPGKVYLTAPKGLPESELQLVREVLGRRHDSTTPSP